MRRVSGRIDDYDYAVPDEAVAQEPPARRQDARLLRVARHAGITGEGRIPDLADWLRPGDLLVLNAVPVAPARLAGTRAATGGRVSILALSWEGRRATVLLGTRGRLEAGEELTVHGDRWRLLGTPREGRVDIEVVQGRDLAVLLEQAGRMPLPPYIRRDAVADPRDALDRERYRTTFAAPLGAGDEAETGGPPAVAAPTAGLHFTPELLAGLQAHGVELARLRLSVGIGTFRPVHVENLDDHRMHAEDYHVPPELASAYAAARREGRRVVAVGTTVVRALESAVSHDGSTLTAGPGRTELFLRPGHRFAAVDALLTNFHQPRSTLLVLVSAFAGLDTIRAAYAEALARGFRLFSYGDAMLLE